MGWTDSSLHLVPLALCAVLKLGKAKEHLLQWYLTHAVVFNVVFLFGCLQSAKHLDGSWEREDMEKWRSHLIPLICTQLSRQKKEIYFFMHIQIPVSFYIKKKKFQYFPRHFVHVSQKVCMLKLWYECRRGKCQVENLIKLQEDLKKRT